VVQYERWREESTEKVCGAVKAEVSRSTPVFITCDSSASRPHTRTIRNNPVNIIILVLFSCSSIMSNKNPINTGN
jgi:hypothetical protein